MIPYAIPMTGNPEMQERSAARGAGQHQKTSLRRGRAFTIIDIIAYNPEMSYEDNIRILFDGKYDVAMAEAICQAMAEYDKLHPQKRK